MVATDKEFINDVDRWPCWPILMLKRPQNVHPNTGYLLSGHGPKIYLENAWRLSSMTDDEMTAIKTLDYANVDALLADGWMVD